MEHRSSPPAYRAIQTYRIASRSYFHLPILVAYLYHYHLDYLQIFVALALYGGTAAFFPTVARRLFSRLSMTASLIVGEITKAAGLVLLLWPQHYWLVLCAQVVSGAGFSFTVGTDAALARVLRPADRDAGRDESLVQTGMFAASFLAGALGAFAFSLATRLPIIASVAVSCFCALVASSLVRATSQQPAVTPSASRPSDAAPPGWNRWQSYYAVNRAVLLVLFTGLIPILILVDHPVHVAFFGLLLGLYTMGGLVASRTVPVLQRRGHEEWVLPITGAGLVVGTALLLAGPALIGVALAVLGVAGGFIRPAALSGLSRRMPDAAALRAAGQRMERVQAAIQFVLTVLIGISLASDVPHWTVTVAMLVAVLVCQSLLLGSRGHKPTEALIEGGPNRSHVRSH
jgi:hypothetical protein